MSQLGAPSSRADSYLGRCIEYINECDDLMEKESYSVLGNEQVKQLLDWCNNEIDKNFNSEFEINERIAFKRMVAAMCIKLMLFIGITYRVARVLKFSDLEMENNTLIVNGYTVRLPLKLSKQFKQYKELFRKKGFNVENGFLFLTLEGEQWGEKTSSSSIPTFLKSLLGQTSITCIIKYGVKQLILSDMSDNVIIKLTGISREILNDCSEPLDDDDFYSYINAKIVKTKIYKYL
jgi:hypothetical protein